jgi:hypothetical protein
MLHQIRLPGYAPILQDFVRFQQQLLEFACTPALSEPLTADRVRQVFGDERGNWLVKKLWEVRSGNATDLCNNLMELTDYIKQYPIQRTAILVAFVHDIDFYSHLDDATFQFSYRQLDKPARDKVKPIMIACYDLLADGFPCGRQGASTYLKRRDVATIFWQENRAILKVCPACDGESPTITRERVFSDVDHFLPKSLYPFLAIHPYNLVPICTDCNRYFKRDVDPIGDHQRETLVDIFHPYGRPAVQNIKIHMKRGASGECSIRVEEQPYSALSNKPRRWNNLNKSLQLKIRWEDCRLPDVIDEFTESLREIGESRRDREEQVDASIVVEELMIIKDNFQRNVGKRMYSILKYSYACYALSHKEEFDRLVQVVMGKDEM